MGDNAAYLYLAESLATNQGYTDLYLAEPRPNTAYPPVLPLMLTPVVAAIGYDIPVLKFVVLTTGTVGLFFIFRLVQHECDRMAALWVTLLCATLPLHLSYATTVMSEVPYICMSMAALYYGLKYLDDDRRFGSNLILAATFLVLACFTRTIGIALIGAVVLDWVINRRSREGLLKAAILCGPATLAVGAWLTRKSAYLTQFGGDTIQYRNTSDLPFVTKMLGRILGNTKHYAQQIPGMFVESGERASNFLSESMTTVVASISMAVGLTMALLIGIGFLRRLWVRHSIVEFYMLGNIAILSVWPWAGVRFYLPVIPFLFFYFIIGLRLVLDCVAHLSGRPLRASWPLVGFVLPIFAIAGLLAIRKSNEPEVLGRWSIDAFAMFGFFALASMVIAAGLLIPRLRVRLEKISSVNGSTIVAMVVGFLALWNLGNLLVPPWGVEYESEYVSYHAAMTYLRDNAKSDNVVLGRKPRSIYIWSRLRTAGLPPELDDPQEMLRYWKSREVDYLTTGHVANGEKLDAKHVFPAIELAGDKIEEVFRDGDARVFKIHKPL